MTTSAVVVGNPKPQSRTLRAATSVASQLVGKEPDLVVDLATYGPAILDWSDQTIAELVKVVGAADFVVVASPTYKGTMTGILKSFLDRFESRTGLRGVAVPVMLGASPTHALASDLLLRPVLLELGAVVPNRGLFILEASYDDPASYQSWLDVTRSVVAALLGMDS